MGSHINEIDGVASSVAVAMEEQDAATREIARSINESAAAAKEVSAKIASVSRDADSVNARAADVREAIFRVSTNLSSLQTVLVQTVRGSTKEADRRQTRRHPVSVRATVIDGAGQTHAASVADISETGALIRGTAGLSSGAAATLRIEGLAAALRFSVRGCTGDCLNVAFGLDHIAHEALARWIAANIRDRAA